MTDGTSSVVVLCVREGCCNDLRVVVSGFKLIGESVIQGKIATTEEGVASLLPSPPIHVGGGLNGGGGAVGGQGCHPDGDGCGGGWGHPVGGGGDGLAVDVSPSPPLAEN